MFLLTVKGKEATLFVTCMTAHAQLRDTLKDQC